MSGDITYCPGVYAESPCPLRVNCRRYRFGLYADAVRIVFRYAPYQCDEKTNRTTCEYFIRNEQQ